MKARIHTILLKWGLLVVLLLAGWGSAHASHFRFGHLSWTPRPDISPTTVDFTLLIAYRRSYYSGSAPDRLPQVGDLVTEGLVLNFGDGTSSGSLHYEVTAISVEQDWLIGVARLQNGPTGVVRKQYAAPRQANGDSWLASIGSCCRISSSRNAPDGNFSVSSRVDLTTINSPPVSNLPPIVSCERGKACTFAVPASDADGDKVRWRFSTGQQSGIWRLPDATPPDKPITIDPDTGIVSWTTLPGATLGLYSLAVEMEDISGTGQPKSSSTIDFLLNLQDLGSNSAPAFVVPPTPAVNSEVAGIVGELLAIHVRAQDANNTDAVVLNHVGLPPGATFTSTRANPAEGVFQWRPTAAHMGERIVTFTAIDSRNAAALPHPIRIKVTDPPLRNVKVRASVPTEDLEVLTASFAQAPSKVDRSGAQTVLDWEFAHLTGGQSIPLDFSVLASKLQPGETRVVTQSVELSYQEAGGAEVRRTLPAQHVQVQATHLVPGIATDRPSYASGDLMLITGRVDSLSGQPATTAARITLRDGTGSAGSLVQEIPALQLRAGEQHTLAPLSLSTAGLAAGTYHAVLDLLDASGTVLATAATPFQVRVAGSPTAVAKVSTDKGSYLPSETVQVQDTVSNAATNLSLAELRISTELVAPDGTSTRIGTEQLAQLAAGARQAYGYVVPLASRPPGQYQVKLSVTLASGTTVSSSTASFTVLSTQDSGQGLVGTLTALPRDVPLGDSTALSLQVRNAGNSAVAGLPLVLRIIDPDTQAVLSESRHSPTLAQGQSFNAASNWTPPGAEGKVYVALLLVQLKDASVKLAEERIKVLAPPIKIDMVQALASRNRVLVLVSCKDGTLLTAATSQKPCVTTRSSDIHRTLEALAIPHAIATTQEAFRQGLRSGIYNTYWISGRQDKLSEALDKEIREAVFNGHGLIMDAMYEAPAGVLDSIAGITWCEPLADASLQADLRGADFAARRLATSGRLVHLDPLGATVQGTLKTSRGSTKGSAVLTRAHGSGWVVSFAFDLVQSMAKEPQWQAVLKESLARALPAVPTRVAPEGVVTVRTQLRNQEKGFEGELASTLPGDARYLQSSPPGVAGGRPATVRWALKLGESAATEVLLEFRAPAAAGSASLATGVSVLRGGIKTPHGDPAQLSIQVWDPKAAASEARLLLDALKLSTATARRTRDNAKAELDAALGQLQLRSSRGYAQAILALLRSVDAAVALPVDSTPIRAALGQVLQDAQWRWYESQGLQ